MAETEHITVARVSDDTGTSGRTVSLPVVELLTGRGFITGKSGSGKSNSASVIAEKLLDNGFGLLIVDIDGEYYGLKEEYEILHAGADEECDIQVTTDHAEKLASLALEGNVPIILDVSSYLDENEAEGVLTEVSRHLFAKAKKEKQPFLMLVEEVHEYIPENGSVGECGKMLIKIGKRGRKHGLGICGISQRPADVKKDFITQCDWLLWHRLTWNNDTKVVRRILDRDYADAVEDLDDGEGFLTTDWFDPVRRVKFFRKRTFDAGATPGLDDFERPDLKSVSSNLVEELEAISDERRERDDRIAELREELDRKNSRIAELERELQDARDMSRMADQFVNALVQHVGGSQPGRTERERMRESPRLASEAAAVSEARASETPGGMAGEVGAGEAGADARQDDAEADGDDGPDAEGMAAFGAMMDASEPDDGGASNDSATTGNGVAASGNGASANGYTTNGSKTNGQDADEDDGFWPENEIAWDIDEDDEDSGDSVSTGSVMEADEDEDESDFSAEAILSALSDAADLPVEEVIDNSRRRTDPTPREQFESVERSDAEFVPNASEIEAATPEPDEWRNEAARIVHELQADIRNFDERTRKMLAFYRENGPATALNAYFAAGGDGDRTKAFAHNRELRIRGLVEHVGRGHYEYALRDHLAEEFGGEVDRVSVDAYADLVERVIE